MMTMIRRALALGSASLALAAAMPLETAHAAEARTFTILVSNVSTESTFRRPDGSTSRVPVAPGAFAIVEEGALAFTPGATAGMALERLAEDGDPEAFVAQLRATHGVREAGRFLHDEPFQVSARPGERLVFAAMFAQSNDLFYAPDPTGIALFDSTGRPRSGEVADPVSLWDSGTEVNERPGDGPNQAPRQPAPNSGQAENGRVRAVDDGFAYPAPRDVLAVSLTSER